MSNGIEYSIKIARLKLPHKPITILIKPAVIVNIYLIVIIQQSHFQTIAIWNFFHVVVMELLQQARGQPFSRWDEIETGIYLTQFFNWTAHYINNLRMNLRWILDSICSICKRPGVWKAGVAAPRASEEIPHDCSHQILIRLSENLLVRDTINRYCSVRGTVHYHSTDSVNENKL